MSVDRHQQGLLISPRFELDDRIYAVHGSFNYAELEQRGLDAHNVLDFSVNSNPYGPSPAVVAALSTVDPTCYPDRECLALRRALAEHLGVTPEEIVVGNGASELIWLIAFVFLRPGDRALIVGPTFGEYARVARLVGAQTFHWDATFSEQFILNSDAIAATITATRPHVVFLCNPNNPTGMWVENHVIATWAGAAPQTLFVVDEAYIEFVDGMSSAHTLRLPNLISVRSMTKEYAIAGLRLGYAIAAPALIAAVAAARPPWNVNSYAQAAGLAALGDRDYLNTTLAQLNSAKSELVAALMQQGYNPMPSATNYFLLPVENAAHFRTQLLQQSILVRDCTSFGLPQFIRIATRRPDENARLQQAIGRFKGES